MQLAWVVLLMSGGWHAARPLQQNSPVRFVSCVHPATGGAGGAGVGGVGLGLGGVGSGGDTGPSSMVAAMWDSVEALATTEPSTINISPLPLP